MIDMAKIADIAIILIDASIGFEMETFEFLSLLRVIHKIILEIVIFFILFAWL